MKYWWVNHNQTARQEIDGGYLWSPKQEANGTRSQFYDNMRIAVPGDRILSYAAGVVGYLGVVSNYAAHCPKPDEFGNIGTNWSNDGWLLPVEWQPLTAPVRPKSIIGDLRPLLPASHSPIRSDTGTGNQKAYLAQVEKTVHDLFLAGNLLLQASGNAISICGVRESLADAVETKINQNPGLTSTEKSELAKARRGQGKFRENVRSIEPKCRITGIDARFLLIASHIKPWRSCDSGAERLDGANGLLLAPHADWLFDRGLLSFADNGCILISGLLEREDLCRLGLGDINGKPTGSFSPTQCRYLDFHRRFVFLP